MKKEKKEKIGENILRVIMYTYTGSQIALYLLLWRSGIASGWLSTLLAAASIYFSQGYRISVGVDRFHFGLCYLIVNFILAKRLMFIHIGFKFAFVLALLLINVGLRSVTIKIKDYFRCCD